MPLPEPTRPVQDAIIDPVWGQWVHDNLTASRHTTTQILNSAVSDLTSATQVAWPAQNTQTVTVPAWASTVHVTSLMTGIYPTPTEVIAELRCYIDGAASFQAQFSFGAVPSNTFQTMMIASKDVTSRRGQGITIYTTGARLGGGTLRAPVNARFVFDTEFRP